MGAVVRGTRSLLSGGLLAFALVANTPSASAQSEEEVAGARAAATEGAKAFQQGRWQDAVDLFTRAESLVHAPPHLLFSARAHAKLGRLVAARELYNKILREQLADDAPPAFVSARDAAKSEIQAIEPRLAKLTIEVEGAADKQVAVTMDGRPVASALIGLPTPADPGKHEITATAEGFVAKPQSVTLAEGGQGQVTLSLVPDPSYKPPAPPPSATPAMAPAAAPTAAPEAPVGSEPHGPSLAVPAYTALGVGAIGLGAGVIFTLQSSSKRSDAVDTFEQCQADGGGQCRAGDPLGPQVTSLEDDAKSAQTLATIGYIVGGVGVAAGVTLLIVDSSSEGGSAAATSGPELGAWVGYRSAGLYGTF